MSELKKIVINKRSGVIHTRDCESVKQMKNENMFVDNVTDIKQIEEGSPCGHCIKKRNLRKIYTEDYLNKKEILEEKRDSELRMVELKYESKLAHIKAIYEEKIRGLPEE